MPGIPKSRGCQVCKRRKVKCDEIWPSCGQCTQIKTDCPGPTNLVKFINKTTGGPPRDGIAEGTAVSRPSSPMLHMRKVRYSNVNDAGAGYGRLQMALPRGNPTTVADRVGHRLASTLERGPAEVVTTFMGYLPEIPKRIAGSPCLRDSVDLFCTAWAGFRSQLPRKPLIAMAQYGKLLRSLQKALTNGETHRIETLAAMTLLERTARLFDLGSENMDFHLKGIRQVFVKKSLPNPDDQLDVKLTNEVYALLLRDWPGSSEDMTILTSAQKEALSQCASSQLSNVESRPFLESDIMVLYTCAEKFIKLLADFQQVFCNPEKIEMASSVRRGLHEMKNEGRQAAADSLARWIEDGAIEEKLDPAFVAGKRYQISSMYLIGLYHAMIMCQLIPLSVLHHLDVMCGTLDSTTIDESRQVSAEMWKMMPAIKSLEPVIAIAMMDGACMSYEFADERGREYVLETILDIDSSVGRYPKEKESLRGAVMDRIRLLTGRNLNQPIQGLVLS
ncbi:unnamed protein product [Clonostachys solani]|uniref:Zn(2)-C6 fungal-type domain-containing protein n=1 Tax=Clonostachys solani TaxID=160281 RepID=A0A9P0EG75_9HYPO|nr:unnamed protein product [Clonostachys solani]